jgi:DNA-binding NtrC family response regulator
VRVFERQHIEDVLAQVRFDKRDAARALGISLSSLYRKLHIERPAGNRRRARR